MLLLFSVAFCDYMTSGLENPLSYFLVGLLLWLVAAEGCNDNGNGRQRRWMFLLLALLVLNRPDYAVLLLPLAILLAVTACKAYGLRGLLRDACPGVLLLAGWLLFALLYFGSPLPNTFYAKMAAGYPLASTLDLGINYYRATLHGDPVSLLIIAMGIALSVASRRPVLLALAAGQALYLGFILILGGDFMQGRFFALPVFLGAGQMALALAQKAPVLGSATWRRAWQGPAVALMVLSAVILGGFTRYPFTPNTGYPHRLFNVADLRGGLYRDWGLLSPHREWPKPATQAEMPRKSNRICGGLGNHALTQPDTYWIDECALSDPFLARLPAILSGSWWMGHHKRRLPTDYFVYVIGRVPAIADESLRGLLRDVTLAARSPALFSRERLAALWRLNTGYHGSLDLSRYRSTEPLPVVSEHIHFFLSLDELDGAPKPDGHIWQSHLRVGGDWRRLSWPPPRMFNALHVAVEPPRLGESLQLSLSYMEGYEIRVNGELVATIDRVGPEGLLKNHTVPLPRPMQVETIEIRALGRHWNRAFSIGHLHLR